MSMTPTAFRTEVRRQIADLGTSGAPEFDSPILDGWRDLEVQSLYGYGLHARSSTRTLAGYTEVVVAEDVDGNVSRYLPMPTGFRRIYSIEFIDPDTDEVTGESYNFTDTEEPGFVRIDDIAKFIDDKVRMYGEREYTAVDDTAMKTETVNVVLWGVVMRALAHELAKRLKAARSNVATKNTDASPGAISAGIETVNQRYFMPAKAAALNQQAVSSLRQ
jgi:hypothetical protein